MEDSTLIDINKAWEISPYNGLAYGAMVLLLGFVAWYFKNQAEEKEQYIRSLITKTHEVADVVTERLADLKHTKEVDNAKMMSVLDEIQRRLENIK